MGKEHYVKYNIRFELLSTIIRDATKVIWFSQRSEGKNTNKKFSNIRRCITLITAYEVVKYSPHRFGLPSDSYYMYCNKE